MITLAAASLSFDGFEDADFAATFDLAPRIGFRALELNCWYPRNLSAAGVRSIRRRCDENGLQPVSLHFTEIGGENPNELSKSLTYGMRGIDMAAELGCTTFVTLGAPRGKAGGIEAIVATLEHLVPYAEEVGITIGLENHDGHIIQTLDDYATILDRLDSNRLGVCADIGHFHASGIANDEIIDRFGDRVVHIHVKDNASFGTKRFVPFGEGAADNVGFVRSMAGRGYEGAVVVELSPGSFDFTDREGHVRALASAYEMFAPLAG